MATQDYNLNVWGYDTSGDTLITLAGQTVKKSDLEAALESINIVAEDDNYVLMVDGREAGVISVSTSIGGLTNIEYDSENTSIVFTFNTEDGEEKSVSVDVSDLVDTYTAGDGLGVEDNQFFIKIDSASESYLSVSEDGIKISGLDAALKNLNETVATVNDNLVTAINTINQNVADGFNTINGGIENEVKPAIEENTTKIAALEETVSTLSSSIESNAANITTVNDNLVTAIETINQNVADGFNTINGGIDNEIRPVLEEHTTQIAELKTSVESNTSDIATVNENLVTAVNTINQNVADGFNTINGDINDEIRPVLEEHTTQISEINTTIDSIKLVEESDMVYALKVGDNTVGTITLPENQFLSAVAYDSEDKKINFTFKVDGEDSNVSVDVSDLVDVYLAGDGLALEGNTFSLKIDSTSESYITVSADGVKISGIDSALDNKTDEMIEGTNGKSYVWNEKSGGGVRFVNDDNTTSFVGVNDGGADGITAQIYSKDATSNVGTRLNVYSKGIFYITGKSNTDADYEADGADFELAVKGDLAAYATKEEVDAKQDALTAGDNITINEGVISAAATDLTGYVTETALNGTLSDYVTTTALDDKVSDMVEFTDISTEENPDRSAIVLKNHDMILGTATSGDTYNLAMVSKWDVADFGTTSLPINLNGSGERPTYNDDKAIALVEDIPSIDGLAAKDDLASFVTTETLDEKIAELQVLISTLESKVEALEAAQGA